MKYLLFFLLLFSFKAFSQKTFSFTLTSPATTSAGVYERNGTNDVLIRTLWSGVNYNAGTYSTTWDGKDDAGTVVSTTPTYVAKVLSNNVTYTWEGTAGNTSADLTGPNIFHGQRIICAVAIAGNIMYTAHNLNEKLGAIHYTPLNNLGRQFHFFNNYQGMLVRYVATDGVKVYWAGGGYGNGKTWMIATKVSDNTEAIGANSSPQSQYMTYNSAFNYVTTASNSDRTAQITGVAVQSSGNYLFVTRRLLNKLYILNKNTYALVQEITTINAPREITCDGSGNLWLVHDVNTVEKYAVNSTTGAISSTGTTLNGLVDPYALAVSPTTAEVAVCDAGTSQQVKFYNGSSGVLNSTLGTAGGYTNSPAVTDYKFAFSEQTGKKFTEDDNVANHQNFASIAFQADGSFWVVDIFNSRVQHYNASKTYVERIMMLGNGSQNVNKTNTSRVFRGTLEFNIDYSNPNYRTSWTLVNNWGAGFTPTSSGGITAPITMSNGRTYAYSYIPNNQGYEIIELTSTGIRFSGILTPNTFRIIDENSNLITWNTSNNIQNVSKYAFAGFNGANWPTWSTTATTLANVPYTATDPSMEYHDKFAITSTGIIATFNGYWGHLGYHLGGIKSGATTWQWKTSTSTPRTYTGPFPLDGKFDNGNNVGNAGSIGMAAGRSIMWGYYGEFWKDGFQTNQYAHYYDDGLLLKVFGTNWTLNPNGTDAGQGGSVYIPFTGMAGNVHDPSLITSPLDNNTLFLYHNDEAWHNGIHRWKIGGLNTINEQVVSLSGTPPPPPPPANTITKVEIYNNNTLLQTLTSAPYQWTWNNVPAGKYVISAKVFDSAGNITTTSDVPVTVSAVVSVQDIKFRIINRKIVIKTN